VWAPTQQPSPTNTRYRYGGTTATAHALDRRQDYWSGYGSIYPAKQSGVPIRNVKKLTRPAPNVVPQHEPWAAKRREREEEESRCGVVHGRPEGVDMTSTNNALPFFAVYFNRLLRTSIPRVFVVHIPFNIFIHDLRCHEHPRRHFHGHWRLLRGLRTLNCAAAARTLRQAPVERVTRPILGTPLAHTQH